VDGGGRWRAEKRIALVAATAAVRKGEKPVNHHLYHRRRMPLFIIIIVIIIIVVLFCARSLYF
jgi:hypothetical protein